MTVLKMLNLSTCHIPYDEVKTAKAWATYQNDSGWVFWTDGREFSDEAPVLAFILKWAAKQKFDYVQLDGDGDVSDDLPTFTWKEVAAS